jgi:YesN/AraC family two-component response regulator
MTLTSPKKILLVEDEQLIREGYKKLLELKGHQVTGATDGKKAIQALNHNDYDLIITDVHMPKMDGLEMISILKRRKMLNKVIVITAYHDFGQDGLFHNLLKDGVAGVLHKPFTLNDLLQIIDKMFNYEFQT